MILHMINKTSLKFVGIFVVVIIAALAAIYYANYYFSPEQKALRYYAELERQYREDTYGGKTPEETLQLFIDALKAGDIELASKYFVVEEREKTKKTLQDEFKVDGNFDYMITGLQKLKRTTGNHNPDEKAFFIIVGEDGIVADQVLLVKNTNSVWKIVDM